jgi:hypothetical protein
MHAEDRTNHVQDYLRRGASTTPMFTFLPYFMIDKS